MSCSGLLGGDGPKRPRNLLSWTRPSLKCAALPVVIVVTLDWQFFLSPLLKLWFPVTPFARKGNRPLAIFQTMTCQKQPPNTKGLCKSRIPLILPLFKIIYASTSKRLMCILRACQLVCTVILLLSQPRCDGVCLIHEWPDQSGGWWTGDTSSVEQV